MTRKLFGLLSVVAVATMMTAACSQSDAGISTAVKSKLAADDTVKGDVDGPAARDRAVELARATKGVRDVVDVLTLAPPPAPTSGIA